MSSHIALTVIDPIEISETAGSAQIMDAIDSLFLYNSTDLAQISNEDLLGLIDSSFLSEFKEELYTHNKPITIVLIVLYSLAFVVGVLGNVFVILVVAKYRHMRTLTNVFLVNLTVGDLLVVSICIPITLGNYIYTDWVYGQILCKVTPFLQGTAVAVSVLSLLSISINRYFAIHKPMKAKVLFSKRKIYLVLLCVWIVSFLAFIPLLFVNDIHEYGVDGFFQKRTCRENWWTPVCRQVYDILIFIILFVIPLLVMGLTYTKIGITLWFEDTKLFRGEGSKKQSRRMLAQRRRTVKMLIFVVILFGICWFPYYVVNIWIDFNRGSNMLTFVMDNMYPLVQLLGLSNSTLNPICYCFLSSEFQRALVTLCCKKRIKAGRNILLMVRFRSTNNDESVMESMETVLH